MHLSNRLSADALLVGLLALACTLAHAQNTPPVAHDQTVNTNEGAALGGTLVATDTDVPPQALTYSIVGNGTKGTAALSAPGSASFTYTPNPGRMGFDTFTFKANDGLADSNVAAVTVDIRPTMVPFRIVTTGTGTHGGSPAEVLIVDVATQDQGVVSSGGFLSNLGGVAIEATGKILAVTQDSNSLVRIDPANGNQTLLAAGMPGFATSVAVEHTGNILVALGPAGISRRDPVNGLQITSFTVGLTAAVSVAVAKNGDLYVADAPAELDGVSPARIVRVDPVSGAVTVLGPALTLSFPSALALDAFDGNAFVADYNAPGGTGGIFKVSLVTGQVTPVASGSNILNPGGIALAPDGTLFTANNGNAKIVQYDPVTLGQNVRAAGGELVNTYGLFYVNPAPLLQGVASRRVHGAAGTFDLPLSTVVPPAINHNPTTEPRKGPTQTLVFTFDKPINAADAFATEGSMTGVSATLNGNEVIVTLSGVVDQQYATVSVVNVASTDGGSGGSGSVRVGFLVGDVNQTRVVSVADLGIVNSVLAQTVTASNFLKDVNASGAISVADKGITNANLTRGLPTP